MSDTPARDSFVPPKLSGCPKNWAEMAGDERKRYCEHCTLHVHDLSAMPRREAEKLLAEMGEDRLCVTYLSDSEGNLVTVEELRAAGYDPEAVPMRAGEGGLPERATATVNRRNSDSHGGPGNGARSRWSLAWLLGGIAAGIGALFAMTGCEGVQVAQKQPPAPESGKEGTGFATPPPPPPVHKERSVDVTVDIQPHRTAGIILPPEPNK